MNTCGFVQGLPGGGGQEAEGQRGGEGGRMRGDKGRESPGPGLRTFLHLLCTHPQEKQLLPHSGSQRQQYHALSSKDVNSRIGWLGFKSQLLGAGEMV